MDPVMQEIVDTHLIKKALVSIPERDRPNG